MDHEADWQGAGTRARARHVPSAEGPAAARPRPRRRHRPPPLRTPRSQGKGIFLFNKLGQINDWKKDHKWKSDNPQAETYVVQRYIDNALLLGGLKFDLRLYVLLTACAERECADDGEGKEEEKERVSDGDSKRSLCVRAYLCVWVRVHKMSCEGENCFTQRRCRVEEERRT